MKIRDDHHLDDSFCTENAVVAVVVEVVAVVGPVELRLRLFIDSIPWKNLRIKRPSRSFYFHRKIFVAIRFDWLVFVVAAVAAVIVVAVVWHVELWIPVVPFIFIIPWKFAMKNKTLTIHRAIGSVCLSLLSLLLLWIRSSSDCSFF